MVGTNPLAQEKFWSNKAECDDAERKYYQNLYGKKVEESGEADKQPKKEEAKATSDDDIDFFASSEEDEAPKPTKVVPPKPKAATSNTSKNKKTVEKDNSKSSGPQGSIAAEIAKARQHIKNSLECVDNLGALAGNEELLKKVTSLEIENKSLKKVTDDLKNLVIKLENRVSSLEKGTPVSTPTAAKPAPAKVEEDEEDDDVDLFGSESEDEETKAEKERVTAERLKAYHAKKAKKPALIAKTSVLLDIKPWDDETDMNAMLECAKSITKEGLVWGASKLVPVGYGINKLQLMCVVEDEKVSIDELQEQITEFEDYVQSVDIAAMSKI